MPMKQLIQDGLKPSMLDMQRSQHSIIPKISVCIPVYNGIQYVEETIESVLAQDYGNLEIIVQDNASTDGTWALLQSLVSKHPQIYAARNEQNVGMAGNWNCAINRVSGDYLMLLSADDLLEQGFLERCLGIFEQDTVDAVATDHYWLSGGQKKLRKMRITAKIYSGFSKLILLKNPFSINFTLFTRNAVERLKRRGCFFRVNLLSCDYEMWIRFSLSGMKIFYLDEPLGSYRLHNSNLSLNVARMNRHAIMSVLKNRFELKRTCNLVYRITLFRFILRILFCAVRYRKFDKRQFNILLAHLYR